MPLTLIIVLKSMDKFNNYIIQSKTEVEKNALKGD